MLIARGFEPSAFATHRFSTPRAIGQKRDRLAVGRVGRLALERQPAHDARRLAALDRQRVEIAEHVEDDRAAVGRHVERWPCHFVGGELDRLGGLEDQTLGRSVALGLFLAAGGDEGAGEITDGASSRRANFMTPPGADRLRRHDSAASRSGAVVI